MLGGRPCDEVCLPFCVLQSSALKTAIVFKKNRRENLFIPIKTANFADRIYKVVSMSKTLYSLALSSVISLDIAAMSLPPHFSAGSGMARGAIVAKLPLKDGYGFERKNGIGRKLNTFCDDNKAKVTKLEEF